ncbi:MAG: exonuclease SbcCD subunit D [Candidatus Pacearchaeota archaeon]
MKFAHLADCHLGSWKEKELQDLNFLSFKKAIDKIIEEKVDFVLFCGDLFDSAYPPIEILKETFGEFRRLKENNIQSFLIAGSHDFSSSGKTFLDVLEKAGLCINAQKCEIDEKGNIILFPAFFKDIAIFGYGGKKSGMEIDDLKKIKLSNIYPMSILMIHTTIKDIVGDIPMNYLEKEFLPLANYYALGHIHKVFELKEKNSIFVYPGPIFPNNFQELWDLRAGSFNINEIERGIIKTKNLKIGLKEVVSLEIELDNALTATNEIISKIDKLNLFDKIFLLKLKGELLIGEQGDILFNEIEEFVKKKKAYVFLRNISSLTKKEKEIQISLENLEKSEEKIIHEYRELSKARFSSLTEELIHALSLEKNEDEKNNLFEDRLVFEIKKVLEKEGIFL